MNRSSFPFSWVVLMLIALMLSSATGCATQQKNTQTNSRTQLPLQVGGVIVVYEQVKLISLKGSSVTDTQQRTRDLVLEKMEKAIQKTLPENLKTGGIQSQVVVRSAKSEDQLANTPANWTRIFVTPLRDEQTCTGLGSCSHRLTVGVRMMSKDLKTLAWSTEIEEPYMVSSFVYDRRYEELAGYVSKAVLQVVVAERAPQ